MAKDENKAKQDEQSHEDEQARMVEVEQDARVHGDAHVAGALNPDASIPNPDDRLATIEYDDLPDNPFVHYVLDATTMPTFSPIAGLDASQEEPRKEVRAAVLVRVGKDSDGNKIADLVAFLDPESDFFHPNHEGRHPAQIRRNVRYDANKAANSWF